MGSAKGPPNCTGRVEDHRDWQGGPLQLHWKGGRPQGSAGRILPQFGKKIDSAPWTHSWMPVDQRLVGFLSELKPSALLKLKKLTGHQCANL